MKILPILAVLVWVGCEDLDFPDPNNPTDETATIQSLVTGAEAVMRQDLGVYLRDLLVVAVKPTTLNLLTQGIQVNY